MSNKSYAPRPSRPREPEIPDGASERRPTQPPAPEREAMTAVTKGMKLPRFNGKSPWEPYPSQAQARNPKLWMGRQRSSDSPGASIGRSSTPNVAGSRPKRPEQAEHAYQRTQAMVYAVLRKTCDLNNFDRTMFIGARWGGQSLWISWNSLLSLDNGVKNKNLSVSCNSEGGNALVEPDRQFSNH